MSGTLMHRHSDIIRRTAVRRGELTTVEGYAPLALPNNAEWKAHSVTLYGKSVQDGVPDPDNPVPIIGVEGKLRMRGGNLIKSDINIIESMSNCSFILENNYYTFTSNGGDNPRFCSIAISTTVGKQYTLSFLAHKETVSTSLGIFISYDNTTDGRDIAIIALSDTLQKYTRTFVAVKDKIYIKAYLSYGAAITTLVIGNIQLEESPIATPYTPYREPSSVTLPPLRGIPLPADATEWTYIDADGVKWWADTARYVGGGWWDVVRRCGLKVFDGMENIYLYHSGRSFYYTISNMMTGNFMAGLCTHFRNYMDSLSDICVFFGADNKNLYVKGLFPEAQADTTPAKTWLAAQYDAGTPVTVLYQLAEPITTDYPALPMPLLPNGEDAYIDNIDGTTTIPYIKAEYYKEAI